MDLAREIFPSQRFLIHRNRELRSQSHPNAPSVVKMLKLGEGSGDHGEEGEEGVHVGLIVW